MVIVKDDGFLNHCLTCYNWKFDEAVGSIKLGNYSAPCMEWSDIECGYTRYTRYDGYCHEWDDAVTPKNK